jgi:hypothetical protein
VVLSLNNNKYQYQYQTKKSMGCSDSKEEVIAPVP